jgi:hypothetical protein
MASYTVDRTDPRPCDATSYVSPSGSEPTADGPLVETSDHRFPPVGEVPGHPCGQLDYPGKAETLTPKGKTLPSLRSVKDQLK